MSDPTANFEKLAQDLLTKAAEFDQANVDSAVDDDDFTRTEVLRDFVEQWLEQKLTENEASEINRLTQHSHNIDADELAPHLKQLLSAKLSQMS